MNIILPDEVKAPLPVFTGIVTKVTKVSPPPPAKGSRTTNLNRKQHHLKKKKGK